MKFLGRLEKSHGFWFLTVILLIFFLLRFPSLFEPYWYGDEGIYQVIGNSLNQNRLLYKDIWDNKPPLLYLLYAIFNSDQFFVRLASLIFGILSVGVFFYLSKKLFANLKIPIFLTFVFALLFSLPTLEGNIANAENFMLLPILLSAFLILKLSREAGSRFTEKLLLAGTLLGIAFLFKIVAVFDLAAFLVFMSLLNLSLNKKLHFITLLVLGFIAPTAVTSLFFFSKGAFSDYISAVFSSNIGYVGYGNTAVLPFSLLFVKLILLFIFISFLFVQRKKLPTSTLFILSWFAFSLFNTLFSQRPYPHYLLVLIPSFSLLLGFLFLGKSLRKKAIVILAVTLLIVFMSFSLNVFGKTIGYYKNFSLFITGLRAVSSYQSFFDRKTSRDYALAQYIKSKTDDNSMFLWGNNAQLYKMVGTLPPGKYIVTYHITYYKDGVSNTKKAIDRAKPKFIVVMPDQKPMPFTLTNYFQKASINNAVIYERLF